MALLTNAATTFSAAGLREDLSDIIYNVSPTDRPGLMAFDTVEATSTLHQWQTDSIRAAAANAQLQGNDGITAPTYVPSVQLTNYTQIQYEVAAVSGTVQAVKKAGRSDELAYQIVKSALAVGNDMERTIWLNQIKSAGDATNAPTMATLGALIVTNDDFGASGSSPTSAQGTDARNVGTSRSLAESQLQTVIRLTFNSGGNPDTLFCTPAHKQTISQTFTGYATHMSDRKDATLYAAVDVYQSDFGTFDIVPDRFITDYGTSQYPLFLLQTDMWAAAYLRPLHYEPLAKTGDNERGFVVVEWTIEARNEKASGLIADLA